MSGRRDQIIGELCAIGHALFMAALPLFIVLSKDAFPPIFFTGFSLLIAGVLLLPLALFLEKQSFWPTKETVLPLIIGSSMMILVYYPIFVFAGQQTSAGNIALLEQSVVLMNFLFFGILGLEKISSGKVAGAIMILTGALIILSGGFSGNFNKGDLIILGATAILPVANYFQKQALSGIGALSITVLRSIVGGVILLLVSLMIEDVSISLFDRSTFWIIVLNSVLAFGLAKWLGFTAYAKIGVVRSASINAASPAFTVLLVFIFLREIPSYEQFLGLILVTIGVLFVIERPHPFPLRAAHNPQK